MKPQLPITTLVTPCQQELLPDRIPEHLGVHMGMAVDKARRHNMTLGIDGLLGALTFEVADRGDGAVGDADIGAEAGQSRAVDNRAALDDQIE